MRPNFGSDTVVFVKGLEADSEPARVTTHFIKGDEPIVVIEGCVLDPLGGDCSSELLEFKDKFTASLPALPLQVSRRLKQQEPADKIDGRPEVISHAGADVV